MVLAEIYSDDNVVVIDEFDITYFLKEATPKQILKTIVQISLGKAPNELQHYLRKNATQWQELWYLLSYCDAKTCSSGEYVSFQVRVQLKDVADWIKQYRPELTDELESVNLAV